MGPDVNARQQSFGRTPLINAASSEFAGAATLKLLLEKGADPNLPDNDGERPLDWAMHRADQAKIDVLKQFGAKDAETPRDTDVSKSGRRQRRAQSRSPAVCLTDAHGAGCVSTAWLYHLPQPKHAGPGGRRGARERHPGE